MNVVVNVKPNSTHTQWVCNLVLTPEILALKPELPTHRPHYCIGSSAYGAVFATAKARRWLAKNLSDAVSVFELFE